MPNEDTTLAPNNTSPESIDIQSDASLDTWAQRFDVSTQQVKDAVAEVGDKATDVELHLKGSRSTTNERRVENS